MSAPARPNLLLLVTDQQRHDTIRALGNPHVRTPHLDWLAETGIAFTRAYSDAPICVPARSTLITGLHYASLPPGIGNFGQPTVPAGHRTLPALLTAAGYQTRLVGKAHYHPPRAHHGWEHMELMEDYYREMARRPGAGRPALTGLGQNEMEPAFSTVPASASLTQWTADRGIDFLETRDPTRPFCLALSFSKPHPPFDPPAEYWELYRDAALPAPLRGDWSRDAKAINPAWMKPTWHLNGADSFSSELMLAARRAYLALITQIDYSLGLVFARLRELGLLENTIIAFTSDHGEMLGDHHMGAKTVPLEGSAHVPLLLRLPSAPHAAPELAGTRCDALACLADIMPTFLRAARVEPPPDQPCDGVDLLSLARGGPRRQELHLAYGGFHAVLSGDHKYCFAEAGGAELLFDLRRDPGESRDLSRRPAARAVRERLRARLVRRLAAAGSPLVRRDRLVPGPAAPGRAEVRAACWPGFHHPAHTREDLMH